MKKQEDHWARAQEQLDTTFREVLSQVSPADLVRLLIWLLSTADNPCAVLTCSVGEVLAATMQSWAEVPDDVTPGPESPPAFPLAASHVQASCPVLWACTCHLWLSQCQTSWPLALQPGSHPSCLLSAPNSRSTTTSLTVHSMASAIKRPVPGLGKPTNISTLAVGTVLCPSSPNLTMEFSPKPEAVMQCQWPAIALTKMCSSSATPLPVHLRVTITLTMC